MPTGTTTPLDYRFSAEPVELPEKIIEPGADTPPFADEPALSGAGENDSPNLVLDDDGAPTLPPPGLTPKTVFGDGKTWQRIADTRVQPWPTICHLEITFGNGKVVFGSGWFLTADTVLTAAHNVFSKEHRIRAAQIRVVPGRNGNFAPLGETYATRYFALPGWATTFERRLDVGAFKVADASIGANAGRFSVRFLSNAELAGGVNVNTAGYPHNTHDFAAMWLDGGALEGHDQHFLNHRFDTLPGQSGSPVYLKTGGVRQAVGVHAYGRSGDNLAVRFTPDMKAAIQSWIDAPP